MPPKYDYRMTPDSIQFLMDNQIYAEIVEGYLNPIKFKRPRVVPFIKKVIFNNPATIVFWSDNTKTVVKCDLTERFDPEKGLAMAIAKKALGNQGNYFNEIKKWVEPYEEEIEKIVDKFNSIPLEFTLPNEVIESLKNNPIINVRINEDRD